MSTLVVSNINDGTTTVPATYVTNGSAKAWVNFNGSGTIAARDSLNLSSLTDNGIGDYTFNFSSNMANGNYTIHASTFRSKNGGLLEGQTPSTSSYRVQFGETVDGSERDLAYDFLANFGELA